MSGDDWQKFANVRLLLAYMYAQPGKKLLFMGGEFGQWREWNHEESLDWHLLQDERHRGLQRWVQDLNHFYRGEPALYELDNKSEGFAWVDCNDAENSVLSMRRQGRAINDPLVIVGNFTPVVRHNYRIGVPHSGFWREVLNSDAEVYGGSQQGNMGGVEASPVAAHGYYHSLTITLPPLAMVFFKEAGGS
jgi:1,4-alpha-glucan branching enzyme